MHWAQLLLAMQGEGYAWRNPITLYGHILVHHVHETLSRYRTMKIFTGQGNVKFGMLLVVLFVVFFSFRVNFVLKKG